MGRYPGRSRLGADWGTRDALQKIVIHDGPGIGYQIPVPVFGLTFSSGILAERDYHLAQLGWDMRARLDAGQSR